MNVAYPLVLRNASVLDTRAGVIIGRRDVVIEDGRIAEISDTATARPDATEIDLGGRTLMPGLCDAHVHVIAATASFPQLLTWSPLYTGARASGLLLAMLADIDRHVPVIFQNSGFSRLVWRFPSSVASWLTPSGE